MAERVAEAKCAGVPTADIDSDEEDEDYVPPEKDSEDEGDTITDSFTKDDDANASHLSPSKQRAVDEAFASLFGVSNDGGGSSGVGGGEGVFGFGSSESKMKGDKTAAKKGRKAILRKKTKQKKLLAEMFGSETASRMLSTSSAVAQKRPRDRPLRAEERMVVTERKKFAGGEIEIKRRVVVVADGRAAIEEGSVGGGSGGGIASGVSQQAGAAGSFATAIESSSRSAIPPPLPPPPQSGGGGLDAVLADISGPQKISTVAKTSADWDVFKDRAGLEEELEKKARGKDAYLVKKDFLQRVDLRTFEKEKEERNRRRAAEGR